MTHPSSFPFRFVRRLVLAAAVVALTVLVFGFNAWPLAVFLLAAYSIARWAATRRRRAKVRRAARQVQRAARYFLQ